MSDVTHILSKVSCFLLKSFHFVGYRNDRFSFPYKSLYFECYATMPMLADAHISSMGCPWSDVLSVSSRQQFQQLLRNYPASRLTCANSEKKFCQRGKVSSPKFSPNWHRWACSLAIAKLLLIRTPF